MTSYRSERRVLPWLVAIAGLAASQRAAAAEITTPYLIQACRWKDGGMSMQEVVDWTACSHFALGYIEGQRWHAGTVSGFSFCPPPGASSGQAAAVLGRWAETNPHLWHLPAGLALLDAFMGVWPCPSAATKKE